MPMLQEKSDEQIAAARSEVERKLDGGVPAAEAAPEPALYTKTLFEALLDARAKRGGSFAFCEDAERQPMTLNRLVIGALLLSKHIEALTTPGERVGLLLPNVNGLAAMFMACQAGGRVPAMLNYSTGVRNMIACCRTAQIKTVFTSRRFVALGKLDDMVEALGREVDIVWLEDVRKQVTSWDKARAFAASFAARRIHARHRVRPGDPAVILFTSGTEGVPKGVVLTHRNLLANCAQLCAIVDLFPTDRMFNALPMFHSLGLTGGFILPLFGGFPTFFYPSPLHYRQIPPLIRDTKATIVLATDTFANGWAKVAEKDDFASLRFFVLGAERVKPNTRELFREKFGLELFEGYGATEGAPVLALNVPGRARENTVGKLLPGISYRFETVEGLNEGRKLWVRGPNIMDGYMMLDAPGVLRPPVDGWHDTGDIVTMDDDGYVTIAGRAKRFAKIGGEMVSLAAVEGYAATVWPDNLHAAVVVDDARKGEQIVLVTDRANADRDDLLAWAKEHGVPELQIPKRFVFVPEMPVMGSGKLDYVTATTLAKG